MTKFIVLVLVVISINIHSTNGLSCATHSYNATYINYSLYNKNHPDGTTLAKDALLINVNTIVLIHGWTESGTWPWIVKTGQGYLTSYPEGINVIIVDHHHYAQQSYLTAVCVSERIGESVGAKLEEMEMSPRIVSCTGFSLGAQICGSAGRFVFNRNGEKFLQIIGIDAAGPLFDRPLLLSLRIRKLRKGDATVVVGVYSNGFLLGFGAMTSLPYADYNFFLNGGQQQPGCPKMILDIDWLSLDIDIIEERLYCSHLFSAHVVWTKLAVGTPYIGTLCPTYTELLTGGRCTNNPITLRLQEYIQGVTPGIYHISTNNLGVQI